MGPTQDSRGQGGSRAGVSAEEEGEGAGPDSGPGELAVGCRAEGQVSHHSASDTTGPLV